MSLFDDEPAAPAAPRKPTLAKVRYTHDALIDVILANPSISQNELAATFGFSVGWMSIIINSDAFQERLRERKAELIDPKIQATIEQRLDTVARLSLDRLIDRLELNNGAALRTGDLVAIAKLGVGDKNTRPAGPAQQNNLYVVNLPPKASSSSEWLEKAQGSSYAPRQISQVVDVEQK
jgi:hypothetical protein